MQMETADLAAQLAHCLRGVRRTSLADWQQVLALQDLIRRSLRQAEMAGEGRVADGLHDALCLLDCSLRHEASVALVESLHPLLLAACRRARQGLVGTQVVDGSHRREWIAARFALPATLCGLTDQVSMAGDPAVRELRRRWGALHVDARLAGLDLVVHVCQEVEREWEGLSTGRTLQDILPALRASAQRIQELCLDLARGEHHAEAPACSGGASDDDYAPLPACAEIDRPQPQATAGDPAAGAGAQMGHDFAIAAQAYLAGIRDLLGAADHPQPTAGRLERMRRSFLALAGLAGYVQLRQERTLACAAACLIERACATGHGRIDAADAAYVRQVASALEGLVGDPARRPAAGAAGKPDVAGLLRSIRRHMHASAGAAAADGA